MRAGDVRGKVLIPHRAGCYAMKEFEAGAWSTPWAYFENDREWRDSAGRRRKHGGSAWLRARCNCSDRPGAFIVKEDALLLASQPERK